MSSDQDITPTSELTDLASSSDLDDSVSLTVRAADCGSHGVSWPESGAEAEDEPAVELPEGLLDGRTTSDDNIFQASRFQASRERDDVAQAQCSANSASSSSDSLPRRSKGLVSTSRPAFAPDARVPQARHSMTTACLSSSQQPDANLSAQHAVSPRATFAPSCPPPDASRPRARRRLPRRSLPVTYFGDVPSRRVGRSSLGPVHLGAFQLSSDVTPDASFDEPNTASKVSRDGDRTPIPPSSSLSEPFEEPATSGPMSDNEDGKDRCEGGDNVDEEQDDDDDGRDWRAEAHIRTHRRLRRDSLDFARARRRTLDPAMFLHLGERKANNVSSAEATRPRRSAPFCLSSPIRSSQTSNAAGISSQLLPVSQEPSGREEVGSLEERSSDEEAESGTASEFLSSPSCDALLHFEAQFRTEKSSKSVACQAAARVGLDGSEWEAVAVDEKAEFPLAGPTRMEQTSASHEGFAESSDTINPISPPNCDQSTDSSVLASVGALFQMPPTEGTSYIPILPVVMALTNVSLCLEMADDSVSLGMGSQDRKEEKDVPTPSPADLLRTESELIAQADVSHSGFPAVNVESSPPCRPQDLSSDTPIPAPLSPSFNQITRMYSSWMLHSPSLEAKRPSPTPTTPLRTFLQTLSGPHVPGRLPDFASILSQRSALPCGDGAAEVSLENTSTYSSPGVGKPAPAPPNRFPMDDLSIDIDNTHLFPFNSDPRVPDDLTKGTSYPARLNASSPGKPSRFRARELKRHEQNKENLPLDLSPAPPLTPLSDRKRSPFKPNASDARLDSPLQSSAANQQSQHSDRAILHSWSEALLRSLSPIKRAKPQTRKRARSASPSKSVKSRPNGALIKVRESPLDAKCTPIPRATGAPSPAHVLPPAPRAECTPHRAATSLPDAPAGHPEAPALPEEVGEVVTPRAAQTQSPPSSKPSPRAGAVLDPGDAAINETAATAHALPPGREGAGAITHPISPIPGRPSKRARLDKQSQRPLANSARPAAPEQPLASAPPASSQGGPCRSALPAPRSRLPTPHQSALPRPTHSAQVGPARRTDAVPAARRQAAPRQAPATGTTTIPSRRVPRETTPGKPGARSATTPATSAAPPPGPAPSASAARSTSRVPALSTTVLRRSASSAVPRSLSHSSALPRPPADTRRAVSGAPAGSSQASALSGASKPFVASGRSRVPSSSTSTHLATAPRPREGSHFRDASVISGTSSSLRAKKPLAPAATDVSTTKPNSRLPRPKQRAAPNAAVTPGPAAPKGVVSVRPRLASSSSARKAPAASRACVPALPAPNTDPTPTESSHSAPENPTDSDFKDKVGSSSDFNAVGATHMGKGDEDMVAFTTASNAEVQEPAPKPEALPHDRPAREADSPKELQPAATNDEPSDLSPANGDHLMLTARDAGQAQNADSDVQGQNAETLEPRHSPESDAALASSPENKASASTPAAAHGSATGSDIDLPTESESESDEQPDVPESCGAKEPTQTCPLAEDSFSVEPPSEAGALRSSNAARRHIQRTPSNFPDTVSRRAQRIHLPSPSKPSHLSASHTQAPDNGPTPIEVHTLPFVQSGSDGVRGSGKTIIRVAGLKWRAEQAAKAAQAGDVHDATASSSHPHGALSTRPPTHSSSSPGTPVAQALSAGSAPRPGPVAIRNAWKRRGLEGDERAKSDPSGTCSDVGLDQAQDPSHAHALVSHHRKAIPTSGSDQALDSHSSPLPVIHKANLTQGSDQTSDLPPAPLPVIRKVAPASSPAPAPALSTQNLNGKESIAASRPVRAVRVRNSATDAHPETPTAASTPSSVRAKSAVTGVLPLSKTELTRLTNANTRRNEKIAVQLEYRRLPLDRPRPPSPSAHIPRLAQPAWEQAASERSSRAHKRAGLPDEGQDDAEQWYEDDFGVRRRHHRLGAGECLRYVSPLRPYKAKGVHWCPELFVGPADRHSTVPVNPPGDRPLPDTTKARPRKSVLIAPVCVLQKCPVR